MNTKPQYFKKCLFCKSERPEKQIEIKIIFESGFEKIYYAHESCTRKEKMK